MRTRRDVLNCAVRAGTGLAFLPYAGAAAPAPSGGELVNDVHSQLNETRVDRVVAVESEAALRAASRPPGVTERRLRSRAAVIPWAASSSPTVRS